MNCQPGTRIIFFAILFFFFSVPNIFGAVQSPLVDDNSNWGADIDLRPPTSGNATTFEHSNKAYPILLADKKKTGGGKRIEKGENDDDDDEGKEKEDDEGKEKEYDEHENEGGKSKDDDKGKGHDDD